MINVENRPSCRCVLILSDPDVEIEIKSYTWSGEYHPKRYKSIAIKTILADSVAFDNFNADYFHHWENTIIERIINKKTHTDTHENR